MKFQYLLALGLVAGLCACKKSEDPQPTQIPPTGKVEVYITPTVGGDAFRTGTTITTPAGEQLTINDFRFFVSDLGLAKLSSEEVAAKPVLGDSSQAGVYLVDFRKANQIGSIAGQNNAVKFSFMADTGQYVDLRFAIAVPRGYNSADITKNPFPINASTGMYWTWNSGFKFLVINGRTPLSTTPVHLSIGQNSRFMIYNFKAMLLAAKRPKIVVTENAVTKIYITYDLNALFTNTDGSNYSFVQQTGKPTPLQVHGGYWSDILKANSSYAMDMTGFETVQQ
jgi:hypothetical protein